MPSPTRPLPEDQVLASFFNQQFGKDALIDKKTLNASIGHALDSPATTRLIDDFLDVFLKSPEMAVAESPAPAASGLLRAGSKLGSSTSSLAGRASPKTLLQRATGRGPRNSPSPPTIGGGGSRGSSGSSSPEASSSKLSSSKRYGVEHFVIACREMHAQCAGLFAGTIIVGNGRSVLGGGAGACVDQFATVMRFNDFQISGFEKDVGKKTDIWCVSDWTCAKLFNKYPERNLSMKCLVAIPYRFMGKPYYEKRREELETLELSPAQLENVTFVPMEVRAREHTSLHYHHPPLTPTHTHPA